MPGNTGRNAELYHGSARNNEAAPSTWRIGRGVILSRCRRTNDPRHQLQEDRRFVSWQTLFGVGCTSGDLTQCDSGIAFHAPPPRTGARRNLFDRSADLAGEMLCGNRRRLMLVDDPLL